MFGGTNAVEVILSTGVGPSGYLASTYGVTPSNPDNGPAWLAMMATIKASGGGRVWYENAPYRFRTAISDTSVGYTGKAIEHMGGGRGGTFFLADGPLLSAGDLLTLNKSRQQHFFNLSFGATTQKTAGNAVAIYGGSDAVDGSPQPDCDNHVFQDVDMANLFNGYYFEDGAGAKGVMGCDIERGEYRNFAAGGVPIWMNSAHGALNSFKHLLHRETVGVAAASRPLATMRLSNFFDIYCDHVWSVYARNGLIIDPGAGAGATTGWFVECVWGGVTDRCISIVPNAAALMRFLQFTGVYLDSTVVGATGMIIEGSAAKNIQISRLSALSLVDALKLDGCSSVHATNVLIGGACTRGLYATGSATDWSADMVFGNSSIPNGIGWAVDAGCDRFAVKAVGAAQYCSAAKADNSGAVTKNLIEVG